MDGWMDACMAWHGMAWYGMYVCIYIYMCVCAIIPNSGYKQKQTQLELGIIPILAIVYSEIAVSPSNIWDESLGIAKLPRPKKTAM